VGGANSCGACEGPAPLPMQGSPLHQHRTAEERDKRVDPGTTVGRDAGGDPQQHPPATATAHTVAGGWGGPDAYGGG
jgi:hypothetical protein